MFAGKGLSIVFLGPDGCGKTTVMKFFSDRSIDRLKGIVCCHIFPGRIKDSVNYAGLVTTPHAKSSRGVILSALKLVYWLFKFNIEWLVYVYPAKLKSLGWLFDRYYHDLIVDPRRYRYGGPLWLARLIGKWIPKPDLWILLDAPAEVLQERKQEVPFEETARQRQAYLDLIKEFSNAVVIDAAQPLDKVVNDTNEAILKFMATRTEKGLARFGR